MFSGELSDRIPQHSSVVQTVAPNDGIRLSGAGCTEAGMSGVKREGLSFIASLDPTR